MCGIIAVLRRRSRRSPPAVAVLEQAVAVATHSIDAGFARAQLDEAADALAKLDVELRSVPGLLCMLAHPTQTDAAKTKLQSLHERIAAFESTLDQDAAASADGELERRNAALVRLKDALWSVWQDRIPHAEAVRELAGDGPVGPAAATVWSSVQTALRALDRLEVRGRDSAGVSILQRRRCGVEQ